MNFILLILVGALAVISLTTVARVSQSSASRVIVSLAALGLAAFCAFGFLASFELSDSARWPWQVAYAALGLGALVPAVLLLTDRGGHNGPVASAS